MNMVQLQITLKIADENRGAAAAIYTTYRRPFLEGIPGALSKALLVRLEDVQVQHGFDTRAHAEAYLTSDLFTRDVVGGLKPLLQDAPDIRIYDVI